MVESNRLVFRLFMALFILAGMTIFTHSIAKVTRATMRQANQPTDGNLIPFYLPLVRRSGTTVCGEITSDTTWTAFGNPYWVTCDVIVPTGVTLTIEAGVMVQNANIEDDVIISGTLQAVGTDIAPIHVRGRVAFMAGSSGVLDHAILEYGGSTDGIVYIASDAVQVVNSTVQYSTKTGIFIVAASPVISSTQIVHNIGDSGGGLYNDSGSPTIMNNNISSNETTSGIYGPNGPGGGLYNLSGNPSILNNTFNDNGANRGGGLYNDSGNPIIENNIFAYNHAYGSGGGLQNGSGSPIIQNNIFTGNWTYTRLDFETYGGGLVTWNGSPIIQNNVFVENVADNGYGGGLCNGSSSTRIVNNIIANNYASEGSGISSNSSAILDYNDVWNEGLWNPYEGITPGLHDISVDPMLVDPANGDFHLAPGSPCIDAGDPYNYPATDFEGDPRPMGWGPEIGADEYEFRTLGVTKSSIPNEASPGATVTYAVTMVNFNSVDLTNVLLTDTLPVETAFKSYRSDGLTCTHSGSTWGGQLKCTLDNASLAPGESRSLTVSVVLASTFSTPRSVVNPVTAVASAGGETFTASDQAWTRVRWCKVRLNDTPMGSDLQAAINASAHPSDVVKVSGECRVHDLSLNKTLILRGGWSRNFNQWNPGVYTTTLDAQGLGRVIEVAGMVDPTIEGFFITGGKADYGGGIYITSGSPIIQNNTFTDNDGVLYNLTGSPMIQNNTFTGNHGSVLLNHDGNAMIQNNTFTGNNGEVVENFNGSPVIQSNIFTGNTGSYGGGGVLNWGGSPTIQNNIFTSNYGYFGGGLRNAGGSPTIQSNIFIGNSAVFGGGLYNEGDSATIRSNIVINNTASDSGGGIFNYSGTVLDYNDVWNNTGGDYYNVLPGTHDISADPLLVDPANGNFHLAPGSPCIDAGDPLNYPPTDFEGDPRPQGPAPDIGADEFIPGANHLR